MNVLRGENMMIDIYYCQVTQCYTGYKAVYIHVTQK
jgi:hypothetical protein